MKKLILLFVFPCLLVSCNNKSSTNDSADAGQEEIQNTESSDEAQKPENQMTGNIESFVRDEYVDVVSESENETILTTTSDIVIRFHSTSEYKPYTDSLYSANSQIRLDKDDWLDYKLPDSGSGFKKLYSRD